MDKLDHRFWYSAAALLTAVELDAIRHNRKNGTLSYATRKALRCQTRPGRIFLYAGWALLTAWLLPHLSSDIEAASETLMS